MSKKELRDKLKQAKDAEKAKDYFRASFFYKDALRLSRNLGNSEKIKLCKKKLVETSKKSKDEFKKNSVEQKIPTEIVDNFINSLMREKSLSSILKKIGTHSFLYPEYEQTKKTAEKRMPVAYSICNLSTISEEGHLVRGGADGSHSWFMRIYSMHQGMITSLYLGRIFNKLIKEKLLNGQSLMLYFVKSKIFPERILKIIKVGINRYFKKDFISAIHILVPQFESLFLFLSEKLGIDIIALNQTREISTQTKTLSAWHLDSEEFQNVWGKDFCEQLKFILFEPLGYKLRHKIAHGEISSEECNYETTTLILYLFIVLTARVKIKSKKMNK